MSFYNNLIKKCNEYTNFSISGTQIPYKLGAKNTPAQILVAINTWMNDSIKSPAEIQAWMNNNKNRTGIDCSGLVYYCLNEASNGNVRNYFEEKLGILLPYPYGISAANLTHTSYGVKKTRAKDITPGCTIRFNNGKHVLIIHAITHNSLGDVDKIYYTHSNSSKGPHSGYITIGDETRDLNANAQIWSDSAYSDNQAKQLYNYTLLLNCIQRCT